MLHLAGQYFHNRAVGSDNALRRGLLAGVGRFPGVKRALEAEMRRLRARAGQRVEAVHQQRPRRLRPDCGVERQQVDLGVPEDVAQIGVAGQGACADRDALVLRVGGAGQMVHGEAQRSLQFIVAFDDYVARDPARIPGGLVRRQHGAPAQRTVTCQRGAARRRGIVLRRIGPRHRDEAVEFGNLPGDGAPAPGPAQWERTFGCEQIAIEPQRCGARHRHALAGALGAPGTEVLLQPHRLHAEPGHRETGLQPHVDAVAVQRETQKLQPGRAVRQRQEAQLAARLR